MAGTITSSVSVQFSAALCRGLIEAERRPPSSVEPGEGFPRLYAAASLKPPIEGDNGPIAALFSAALCRGLIEASSSLRACGVSIPSFSAALCRGLIEAAEASAWLADTEEVFRGFMPRPH